jgi:hypothetical protein
MLNDARSALFNCKLFQEGVEIPALEGVFFASPRHSPRDIIQSLCRPLNVVPGKPQSVVFIPLPCESADSTKYADIVPIFDALIQEDPRLYEFILNPKSTYPIDAISMTGIKRPALLSVIKKAVRYSGVSTERLMTTKNIPWTVGFGELQRVVVECGRYPKTTDSFTIGTAKINFHRVYRHYADEYAKHVARVTVNMLTQQFEFGAAICEYLGLQPKVVYTVTLEPHQLAELESLPGWHPYGIEGPYPWRECLETLDAWLTDNEGVPPPVEINKGGYVGLEATPIERLSGALTCVNQGDGKPRGKGNGLVLSVEKQQDLDFLCDKHGLTWRKKRDANNEIAEDSPQTFIQEAYARFKEYYAAMKAKKNDGSYVKTHFPDYPLKHNKQQALGTNKESIPARWKSVRRRFK